MKASLNFLGLNLDLSVIFFVGGTSVKFFSYKSPGARTLDTKVAVLDVTRFLKKSVVADTASVRGLPHVLN